MIDLGDCTEVSYNTFLGYGMVKYLSDPMLYEPYSNGMITTMSQISNNNEFYCSMQFIYPFYFQVVT